jgi:ComF family protein
MLSLLTHAALRVLSPPCCAACDEPLDTETVFCPACAGSVLPPPLASAAGASAAAYGGAVANAVVRFKYASRSDLARPLAHLMLPLVTRLEIDVVVPVPLHRERLRERGYNQAALLARPVAEHLRRRVEPLALARERATAPQASLSASERSANVARAFRVRQPRAIEGRRVLLVDDVRTTGATLSGCATAIFRAGALAVHFLTVAQA